MEPWRYNLTVKRKSLNYLSQPMTSNGQLPVILNRPHGGLAIPSEVESRLAITNVALYNDCDLCVDQLFDFDQVESSHSSLEHKEQNDLR